MATSVPCIVMRTLFGAMPSSATEPPRDDLSAAEPETNGIDVDAVFAEHERAGDGIERLRKSGDARRGVLEFGGAGEARRGHRSSEAAGNDDLASGAKIGNKELQQRRFERAVQIDLEPFRAGHFGETTDCESRWRCAAESLR